MDLRLHIGVHRTRTQHLRKMLALNSNLLMDAGVCVPSAELAEKAFARAVRQMKANNDIGKINADLLSELTQDKEYRRIVMIDPKIAGSLMRPIGKEFFTRVLGRRFLGLLLRSKASRRVCLWVFATPQRLFRRATAQVSDPNLMSRLKNS